MRNNKANLKASDTKVTPERFGLTDELSSGGMLTSTRWFKDERIGPVVWPSVTHCPLAVAKSDKNEHR